jgi:hypothetical protein
LPRRRRWAPSYLMGSAARRWAPSPSSALAKTGSAARRKRYWAARSRACAACRSPWPGSICGCGHWGLRTLGAPREWTLGSQTLRLWTLGGRVQRLPSKWESGSPRVQESGSPGVRGFQVSEKWVAETRAADTAAQWGDTLTQCQGKHRSERAVNCGQRGRRH